MGLGGGRQGEEGGREREPGTERCHHGSRAPDWLRPTPVPSARHTARPSSRAGARKGPRLPADSDPPSAHRPAHRRNAASTALPCPKSRWTAAASRSCPIAARILPACGRRGSTAGPRVKVCSRLDGMGRQRNPPVRHLALFDDGNVTAAEGCGHAGRRHPSAPGNPCRCLASQPVRVESPARLAPIRTRRAVIAVLAADNGPPRCERLVEKGQALGLAPRAAGQGLISWLAGAPETVQRIRASSLVGSGAKAQAGVAGLSLRFGVGVPAAGTSSESPWRMVPPLRAGTAFSGTGLRWKEAARARRGFPAAPWQDGPGCRRPGPSACRRANPVDRRPGGSAQKSMPPMLPMPPPAPAAGFSSGTSAMVASVVMRRPATDAASWSAVRTTLVGSMTPAFTRFS